MSISRKSSVFYMRAGVFCLMFSFAVTQSFASGIPATNGVAQPATCDVDTLGSATGPVQLRADFTPEIIDLRWYNNNTLVNVTSTSNTCTYDTAISLPTDPTKPGYKFKGWKVIPEYDFSTLPTNVNGTVAYGKGKNGNSDFCSLYTNGNYYGDNYSLCKDNSALFDLNNQEWKTVFPWGTIYGMALCSSTAANGGLGTIGEPDESSTGSYCWCKATGYVPNGSSVKYAPSNKLKWVFYENNGLCSGFGCVVRCGSQQWGLIENPNFRQAVFGVAQ